MRRNRKKRTHSKRMRVSVSLFPFLAVLICTLGVLIVMLVMAAKSADVDARNSQAEDDALQQSRIEALESARDVHLARIEGLKLVRPEAVDRLDDARTNRSYLEDEIRKLKREFKRVGDELVELDRQSQETTPQINEYPEQENIELIKRLKQEIELSKTKLEAKRETAKQTGPAKYVIMPHKGSGGTFRRPIFIECTQDAITLQPSGIELAKSEFIPPLQPGNMLDSALLAIREYWQRYDLAGTDGSPYPLIVVRPDGAETFVLARKAMKSWDDEFGYELVESGISLEFGRKDLELEKEVKDAIEEARRRQRIQMARTMAINHRAAAGRYGGRNSRPGLMASGPKGGFVSNASGVDDLSANDQPKSDTFVTKVSSPTARTESNNSFSTKQSGRSNNASPSSSTHDSGSPNSAANSANPNGESGNLPFQNPYADQSLAKKRGPNWALPTQTPGATAYVRPIRIVCRSNVLEIYQGSKSTLIQMPGATSKAVGPMIDEIWKQIDAWGIPGANAYWKPQLKFQIAEGGRERFLQLKGLLYKSGLTVGESRQ